MKILITAFEPFGERSVNASLQVLDGIVNEIGQHQIFKRTLRVDHVEAPTQLKSFLVEIQPDAVICLGEAGGSDYIRLEFVAINWMDFRIPDNAGKTMTDLRIIEGDRNAYFSTLPLRKFESRLKEKGIPVKISMTAGTYLCNQVFFTLMQYLDSIQVEIPAGFIHLPAEIMGDEAGSKDCDLELCVKGVDLILEMLVS